jgi:hypothetical protein
MYCSVRDPLAQKFRWSTSFHEEAKRKHKSQQLWMKWDGPVTGILPTSPNASLEILLGDSGAPNVF